MGKILKTAEEPTCRLCFTTFNCLRTSSNFSDVLSVLFVATVDRDQQKTANRQNATSFISLVSAAGTGSPRCFSKDLQLMQTVASLTFFILIPEETGKPLRELESCRNWRVWVMKFLFHWQSPLRDPKVASSGACVGPIDASVWM